MEGLLEYTFLHMYFCFQAENQVKRILSFEVPAMLSRQASLARQAFLVTPLHGARCKTGKTLTPKSSAM